jgi:hypothetical protein
MPDLPSLVLSGPKGGRPAAGVFGSGVPAGAAFADAGFVAAA